MAMWWGFFVSLVGSNGVSLILNQITAWVGCCCIKRNELTMMRCMSTCGSEGNSNTHALRVGKKAVAFASEIEMANRGDEMRHENWIEHKITTEIN